MLHHYPIPPHTTLAPLLGPLAPQAEGSPRGLPDRGILCPFEITRLKGLFLCVSFICTATPSSSLYDGLRRPPGLAKALSPP